MKVKELIVKLGELDPSEEIYIYDDEYCDMGEPVILKKGKACEHGYVYSKEFAVMIKDGSLR